MIPSIIKDSFQAWFMESAGIWRLTHFIFFQRGHPERHQKENVQAAYVFISQDGLMRKLIELQYTGRREIVY